MGYSLNLYLDKAISEAKQKQIISFGSPEDKKTMEKTMESKPLQIFLYLRFLRHNVKVYVGRKATQRQWDAGKQRVNPNFYKGGAPEVNRYLGKLLDEAQKLHEVNLSEGRVTAREQVREIVDRLNLNETGPKPVSLEEAFDEYLRLSTQQKSPNTKKNYVTMWNLLARYAKARRKPMDFTLFTAGFPKAFSEFLGAEAGQAFNTIAKHLRSLKTFVAFTTDERPYNTSLEYRKWRVPKEKGQEIHTLPMEELIHLLNHQFESERLSQVRDVFCFACFTGLRFSDVANLRWEAIKEDSIRVLPVKTRHTDSKSLYIPLNKYSRTILERYRGQERPLPVISAQKTNDYLKEIGRIIGLNEPVKVLRHAGSGTEEVYVPKWQVLTFHIARKTFVTNSLLMDIPERVVREISGHKSEKEFAKYVNFTESYKKQQMADTWDSWEPNPINQNTGGLSSVLKDER